MRQSHVRIITRRLDLDQLRMLLFVSYYRARHAHLVNRRLGEMPSSDRKRGEIAPLLRGRPRNQDDLAR